VVVIRSGGTVDRESCGWRGVWRATCSPRRAACLGLVVGLLSFLIAGTASAAPPSAPAGGLPDESLTTLTALAPDVSPAVGACEEEESAVHPVVTSVEPKSGPAAGGTSVTIRGEHFTIAVHCALSPVKRVLFGSKEASFSYVHEGPYHEGELVATAPAGTGTVNVTVETATTSATSPADQFTYEAPAPPVPAVTKVEPDGGPAAGGTTVTVTGTGFADVTAVKFGSTAAASYSVTSESSITAVSPAGAGKVDVTVTNATGTSAAGEADKFTYAPTVTKVEPSAGSTAGGNAVTITGPGFSTDVTAVMFGSTPASSYTVAETSIVAVSPPGTGTVNVTVANAGGTSPISSADQFTYKENAPTVTAVSPNSGEESGGKTVTITGTHFAEVSAVKFGKNNASSFKVESESSISAVSPAGKGKVDVTVIAEGTASPVSSADKFSYDGPSTCSPHEYERPQVMSVEPKSGPAGGGNSVTIKGEYFYVTAPCEPGNPAIAVWKVRKVMFGNKEAVSYKEVVSEGRLGEVVAIAPPGSGTVNVTVETWTTSPIKALDQYSYPSEPPTVAKVEPEHGPAAGGSSVNITGTNLNGATAVKFGSRNATSFTVNSETSITAVAPPWGSGDGVAEVSVTTPGGNSSPSLGDSFVYEPTVTKVEPSGGPASGGTAVTISGAAFEGVYSNGSGERPPFVKAVKFGSNDATSFKVEPSGQISAIAPPGMGTVDVTVATEGGTSPTSTADQFTYEPPTIHEELSNWLVSGSLHVKKLNQPITLPEGSRFNGAASLDLETDSGPVSGTISVPAFSAPVKILGLPATVGLEITQVGSIEGSLAPSTSVPGDFSLSLPTKADIGFSSITIFGLKMATKCVTAEPLSLSLLDTLSLEELLSLGADFVGTTNFPTVKCEGTNSALDSAILTSLFSGPGNSYSIMIGP
jgi:hypothetical protein